MVIAHEVLEPGWLARDVARASARAKQWDEERKKNARPVTLVVPEEKK